MQRMVLLTPVQEAADPTGAVALAIAGEDMAGVFQALVRRVPRVATACTVIVEGGVPESC